MSKAGVLELLRIGLQLYIIAATFYKTAWLKNFHFSSIVSNERERLKHELWKTLKKSYSSAKVSLVQLIRTNHVVVLVLSVMRVAMNMFVG